MPKRSDQRGDVLTGLLGLGSHSSRKNYYPELLIRLEELEAERNRYKWLFENAALGIFQASLERGLLAANPSMAKLLGYPTVDDVVQAYPSLAEGFFIGGREEFQSIRKTLLLNGELTGYETQLLREDGRAIDVRMSLLLKPDAAESVVEAFVADITERKQAQVAMQRLNDELEQRVQERTRELEALNDHLRHEIIERERVQWELRDARDAAEQANRSKDRYLAAASHDLLQPLNAARLLLATLRERSLEAAEAQLVERSHSALESTEDLLTDLLDIARLDQSSVKPEWGDYALADIVDPLVDEFRAVADVAGLQLRSRPGNWAVRTDYRLLSRILRNLLSNAIRYTDQGRVLIGCRLWGSRLSIQVWDTGRGIPADKFDEIFQEFNQLQGARAGQRKGVGLGLAIVERITNLLDTRITLRSIEGRGSMFAVDVPLARMAPATPQVAPGLIEQLSTPLQGRRLLVIDNEPIILDSMRDLLGQWGALVYLALDAASSLEVLGDDMPDVILVDYHLDEGRTGDEAVSLLREHFQRPIPAIMITADRSEHCQQTLRELGIPVLNKPVKAGKLRAMLGQMLKS
ncbi:NahK/ErcS family hybrid sensor histidine kinase/response regulator [Halopseudomonas phragmitis]|uniref:histidine kinase n=1 Tax=Halopseudomonas phragmitis TaxID=1931241 RepID=A0A1V0B8N9_9GAMM|nr:NahK/ErcS family hybrid sensor histidine kinase/response regulator [Halopseudomonas phragmitis]AQZ96306.1 hybrid sensor histidine kinase/response regulator [Halopseudomonas phragmitis]